VYIAVLVLISMSSLIKQFSGRKSERLVWKYFEAQVDTRKRISKCLVTVSKGKICGHLVAGKNDFFHLKSHTHSEQLKEFKEYEQKKKTSLKQKQYEAGNNSIVSLCITCIKSRRDRKLKLVTIR